MYVSDAIGAIFAAAIIVLAAFAIKNIRAGKTGLLHRIYYWVCLVLALWMLAIIGIKYTDPTDVTALRLWDDLLYIGNFAPTLTLLTAICFINGHEKMPRKYLALLLVPAVSTLVVWTDPLHHLFYVNFSLDIKELVFGPYMYVSSVYTMGCFVAAMVLLGRFALRNRTRLYLAQTLLICLGILAPMVANILATMGVFENNIVVTPLSFIITMIVHGAAIYQFHLFDIKPIAFEKLFDWTTNCYVVLNEKELVVMANAPFRSLFGESYGIKVNGYLRDAMKADDVEQKSGLYNLATAIDSCRRSHSTITYEQSVHFAPPDGAVKLYYFMAEVAPLDVGGRIEGFVVVFKDVTAVKEGMQRLADSQARMMEQERLASLGQMVGGLAHNLKTPIMSISGGVSAVEALIEECVDSIGDPDVTEDDFREVYSEMSGWLTRFRDACSYMSDIITAVKGQASNFSVSDDCDFSVDEMLKRVSLLLRHEFLGSGCSMSIDDRIGKEAILNGDITNFVQVMNNLVSNAIDAISAANSPDKRIVVTLDTDETRLLISVKDHGPGVSEDVADKLFRQMITSKGAAGTGLGIFISNTVIRGKFGGRITLDENEGGGAVFTVALPLDGVTLVDRQSP